MNLAELCLSCDPLVRSKAFEMREKFDKYWDGLKNINKLLIVASVFDPRNKMQFANLCFEQLYGKDSEDSKKLEASVEVVMRQLFEEYSGNLNRQQGEAQSSQTQSGTSTQIVSPPQHAQEDNSGPRCKRIRSMYRERVKEKGIKDANNELELYLKEDVADPNIFMGTDYDVLSWWKLNNKRFPILSEIAKDVLAMQVSSVASESAFSTSGRILDPYRSCLTHYMIEVLMCTEQWLKEDIHFSAKGSVTIEQLLAEVELQDSLEKGTNCSFNVMSYAFKTVKL